MKVLRVLAPIVLVIFISGFYTSCWDDTNSNVTIKIYSNGAISSTPTTGNIILDSEPPFPFTTYFLTTNTYYFEISIDNFQEVTINTNPPVGPGDTAMITVAIYREVNGKQKAVKQTSLTATSGTVGPTLIYQLDEENTTKTSTGSTGSTKTSP